MTATTLQDHLDKTAANTPMHQLAINMVEAD